MVTIENLKESASNKPQVGVLKNLLLATGIVLAGLVTDANATTTTKDKLPTNRTENSVEVKNEALKFIQANFLINGTAPKNFDIKEVSKDAFELSYDFDFAGIKGFSNPSTLNIKTNVVLIYESNNIYVQFQDMVYAPGVEVSDDGTEIIVDDVVYNVSAVKDPQKGINIRITPDPDKTEKKVLERIASLPSESIISIKDIPELENLQAVSLADILLGEEIYKDKDGEYYRTIFLKEKDQYRPIRNIYFDKKGLGFNKDKTVKANIPTKVLGEALSVKGSSDQGTFKIKEVTNVEGVITRIKSHQKKLIDMINDAQIGAPDVFVGANKEKKDRPWSDKEEFAFNTELLKLKLIDDTYIFQWGTTEDQVIRFGVVFDTKDPAKDQIVLKNIVGQTVTSYDIKVSNDAVNDFYSIEIKDNRLLITKIKNSVDVLTDAFPKVEGDETIASIFAEGSELKKYFNNVDQNNTSVEYFTAEGKKVTAFPSKLTTKGLWELKDVSTNVQPLDLYDRSIVEASGVDLSSLNITEQDIQNTFESILTTENVVLKKRKVVAVYKDGKYVYCTVKQKNDGAPYVVEKDADLYAEANEILKGIADRLKLLSTVKSVKLEWVNRGEENKDLEKFVGGEWGLGKMPLPVDQVLSFLKDEKDKVTQTIVWGEGKKVDIPYIIKEKRIRLDEGFFKRMFSDTKAEIGGQLHTVELKATEDGITLLFDVIEKRK